MLRFHVCPSSNRTCGFPASGFWRKIHAFAHGKTLDVHGVGLNLAHGGGSRLGSVYSPDLVDHVWPEANAGADFKRGDSASDTRYLAIRGVDRAFTAIVGPALNHSIQSCHLLLGSKPVPADAGPHADPTAE